MNSCVWSCYMETKLKKKQEKVSNSKKVNI